ncbi:hypothetical protein B0H65DRAFT_536838 [Neurospora tetraspora]|uniref:Uncharacterized protein n=1 Tax=Neurospora tetraspora TaxID=94610 RepID=A0AAE0JIV6_9PEZI|nr:hypothetical protein B0H65DRAFT_536838 [Neurospora tetraspora]
MGHAHKLVMAYVSMRGITGYGHYPRDDALEPLVKVMYEPRDTQHFHETSHQSSSGRLKNEAKGKFTKDEWHEWFWKFGTILPLPSRQITPCMPWPDFLLPSFMASQDS